MSIPAALAAIYTRHAVNNHELRYNDIAEVVADDVVSGLASLNIDLDSENTVGARAIIDAFGGPYYARAAKRWCQDMEAFHRKRKGKGAKPLAPLPPRA